MGVSFEVVSYYVVKCFVGVVAVDNDGVIFIVGVVNCAVLCDKIVCFADVGERRGGGVYRLLEEEV